jgi:DNA-binding transcriptional MerR regulator
MANLPHPSEGAQGWSPEALALAAQAKVLSGNKLEQLVIRLQRHTGRPSEKCWRFVIQYGLKGRVAHRRWTDEEVDFVREEIVKRSVDEIAKKLGRTPKSVRSMLQRNSLGVREIRCDIFSLEGLARALRIRKDEIRFWIEQGWLEASVSTHRRRRSYTITPEALAHAYKHHLTDLLKRGVPNQSLFEAYVQYVHSPKHTVGEQLLDVRRDKRERAAFAALNESGMRQETPQEDDENDDDDEEEYRISFDGNAKCR